MTDINIAKLDPTIIYARPIDVLKDDTLSKSDKIDILRRWAYDEREMAVAEEENMTGTDSDKSNTLDEILKCLLELNVDHDTPSSPPTKQG
jgi:hypothetical protein